MAWLYRKRSKAKFFATLILVFVMVLFSMHLESYVYAEEGAFESTSAKEDDKYDHIDDKDPENSGHTANTKMALEIDPDNWDPNGSGNGSGEDEIPEETEIQDPTIPYAPYEDILEIPLEGIEEQTETQDAELIPLAGVEEQVEYLGGEGEATEVPETLAAADYSPLTGDSRNSTMWMILSILSFLGILCIAVFRNKEF